MMDRQKETRRVGTEPSGPTGWLMTAVVIFVVALALFVLVYLPW